jgi:uncharacterized protein (TIGR00369 family)
VTKLPISKEQIQQWLGRSPFITSLGLQVTETDPDNGQITMRASMRPEFERGAGTGQWHGGPVAALIDTVGDYALVMLLGRPLPTINFRVDYLRPAIKTSLTLVGRVRRSGKSVGIVDIDVFDDARNLVAVGRATYSSLTG